MESGFHIRFFPWIFGDCCMLIIKNGKLKRLKILYVIGLTDSELSALDNAAESLTWTTSFWGHFSDPPETTQPVLCLRSVLYLIPQE